MMKTVAILSALLASAAAFAPASVMQQTSTTSLNAKARGKAATVDLDNDIGASKWDGGYFDPLGLVADGDQAKFDRLRLVEIKHGRE